MRTSSTCPALAPRTATGPVIMCGPFSFCGTLAWIAESAAGTVKPEPECGIAWGAPDTVDIITSSPGSTVIRGLSDASKKPQCTVPGAASRRCVRISSAFQISTAGSLYFFEGACSKSEGWHHPYCACHDNKVLDRPSRPLVLLRAHRERSRCRCTPHKCDELAPPHGRPPQVRAPYQHARVVWKGSDGCHAMCALGHKGRFSPPIAMSACPQERIFNVKATSGHLPVIFSPVWAASHRPDACVA